MANKEQMNLLKQGPQAWNAWRAEQAEANVDLSEGALRGLDPEARYAISDLDEQQSWPTMTGKELMERGLTIQISGRPGAVSVVYEKVGK